MNSFKIEFWIELKSVKLHNVSDGPITSLLNASVISESTPPWTSALTCMWSVSRGCIRWRGAPGFIRSRRTLCTSSRRCSGPCSSWWAQISNLKPCDWPMCVRQSRFSSPHTDSWGIQSDVDPDWRRLCFPHRCCFHLPLVSSVQLTRKPCAPL